jgi:hypothetical protein
VAPLAALERGIVRIKDIEDSPLKYKDTKNFEKNLG